MRTASSNKIIKIASAPSVPRNDVHFNWQDNLAVQKLLDVVVEVMAEEYVRVARENKDVFMDPGYSPSANSGMTEGGLR